MLEGSCHCGTVTVRFDTTRAPSDLPVRLCGCTFCLKHRPRYTSDPGGHVTIGIADEASVTRYRFGLQLADFLVCKTCGVFVAAYEPGSDDRAASYPRGSDGRAVINSAALARAAELTSEATLFTTYDTEDAASRTARRAKNWTPATLAIGR